MSEKIKTVAIIGAGFMGSQIASRAAVFGYNVRLNDNSADVLTAAVGTTKYHNEAHFSQNDGNKEKATKEQADARITFHKKIEDTVKDADLIIEAVVEDIDIKKEIFSEIEKFAKPHAIIATNSSSFPVSKIEEVIKKKDRIVNIHFYAPIPERYIVDVMGGTSTTEETMNLSANWVRSIGCLPLMVKKECMGFVFNRVWRSVKREALKIWAEGNADITDVDRGWMVFTGMAAGLFGGMDFVGLDVVYDIEMAYYNDTKDPKDKPPDALKEMVDRGDLGMKTGKGFYDWSDPEFVKPGFLDPKKK